MIFHSKDVAQILATMVVKTPARERHARPLTTLRNSEDKLDKDAIAEVWADVLLICEGEKIQLFGAGRGITQDGAGRESPSRLSAPSTRPSARRW